MIGAALKYADLGYVRLLPVVIGPRAGAPPKETAWWRDGQRAGVKTASRNASELKARWPTDTPDVGVAGVFDDLMIDNDEPDELPALMHRFPELVAAPFQRTPSGGAHLLVRVPAGWGKIATGKWPKSAPKGEHLGELRGLTKAYVVLAPSRIDDRPYAWELAPPLKRESVPQASAELMHYLTDPPAFARCSKPTGHKRLRTTTGSELIREVRYAEAALENQVAELAAMQPDTGRNEKLNAAAYSLGHKVASGHLDRGTVEAALLRAAAECKVPAFEAERTLRSGLEAGMREPWPGLPEGPEPLEGRQRHQRKRAHLREWFE